MKWVFTTVTKLVLLTLWDTASCTDEFRQVSTCICPGYSVVYECSVNGLGFTLWSGSIFDCSQSGNEILLSHSEFNNSEGVTRNCNDGNIIGRSIQANMNTYESRLTILDYDSAFNGGNISCSFDSAAISANVKPIGTAELMTSDPFPPPNDIQLVQISAEQLEFNWSAPTVDCLGLSYRIKSNCGICSNYTNSTYTTCFINQDATTINRCNFSVGTIICDSIVGSLSNPLNIVLRVLNTPNVVSVNLTFNGVRGYLTAVNITFSQLDSFNVTDGISGSAIYHLATYNFSTPSTKCIPRSVNIISASNSACVDENCTASFSHPASCLSSATVSLASVNIIGRGLAKNVTIGSDNSSYLRVNYNHDTKTITCTFLGELESSSIKSCHIAYGICQPQASGHSEEAMSFTTIQSPNTATIRLPSAIMGYCFTATAAAMSNSGYIVSVQLIDGVIVDSAGTNPSGSMNYVIIGILVAVCIFVIIYIVLSLIIFGIIFYYKKARTKSHDITTSNSGTEFQKSGQDHIDSETEFNDHTNAGYIIHESSKMVVHPLGDSHNHIKNGTHLVVRDQNDALEKLKVRFVPVPGYGHFGFIEHVLSSKIIHPMGGSTHPRDDAYLVYHSDRHNRALFGFDEESHEIMHIDGKIWHPYQGSPEPENDTKCVLYHDRHEASKFYFGDIDGNPISPYPLPNLSGDWKVVWAFIIPETSYTCTIKYMVGKLQTRSTTYHTAQSVWKGNIIGIRKPIEIFKANNDFSNFVNESCPKLTWEEESERSINFRVTEGETVVVWQYVFAMEQYGDEWSFQSTILRKTNHLDIKPQLSCSDCQITSI